jgi:hypothetical protein
LTRLGAVLAVGSLAVTGLVLSQDAPAEAVFATNDNAPFGNLIDWFDWGGGGAIPMGQYTNTRVVGASEIVTVCTLSNATSALKSYKPGGFQGDGLDNLYNVGGTDGANTMNIGITNVEKRVDVNFDVSCTMKVGTVGGSDHVTVDIPGLVVADAESSVVDRGEFIEARPASPSTTTWRLIGRYLGEGCDSSLEANLGADGALNFKPVPDQCTSGSPTAVLFMDGSAGAHIRMFGASTTAVAIGVVSYVDYADGPASYGAAGVLDFPSWSGGEVQPGVSDLMSSDLKLATIGQPQTRLGHLTDGEPLPPFSADAKGDDNNAETNDEDLAVPAAITGYRGGVVIIKDLVCAGPGRVFAWIDFNGDSVFDPVTERGGPVPTTAGGLVTPAAIPCGAQAGEEKTFSVAWNVPADARPTAPGEKTLVRIGITTDQRPAEQPMLLAIGGELEDHAVDFELDPYIVTKASNGSA